MTFSYEVKKELADSEVKSPECALAELSALIHAGGELGIASIGYYIEIVSDNELIKSRADKLLYKLYGVTGELTSFEGGLKNQRCALRVTGEIALRILEDCGLMRLNDDNLTELVHGIDPYIVNERAAVISYITGAFLGAGSVSAPVGGGGGGYHLGFNLSSAEFAADLNHLLAQCDIFAGSIESKGGHVVYLKGRDAISDALALMGASRAVLKLNKAIVERQVRNRVNRQTNFIGANLGRSAAAAAAQIEAIRLIEKRAGLESLPENLKELARARLAYPEYTMAELMQVLPDNITKSGINHRFEKLLKIADTLIRESGG